MPAFLSLPLAYLIGSIPSGLLVVKVATGKDVREIESGRTGGTNAMRAAGPLAGLLTAILDISKGAAAIWVGKSLFSGSDWIIAINGLLAILGHNYSAFLVKRNENGNLHFQGGAGGATTLGVAIGLWVNSWLVILPIAGLVYLLIGYASLTTISIALSTMGIFTVKAIEGATPWVYAVLGAAAVGIVLFALKPNIQRIKEGTERRVHLLARIFNPKKFK
ncbi:MAG: glycerol-3-phosphate acyltransferase [Anaerolineaceae bacterium]|nr:glycerol-3-phosphate acyltransferase [Anaerolineaceae bacterium]